MLLDSTKIADEPELCGKTQREETGKESRLALSSQAPARTENADQASHQPAGKRLSRPCCSPG
jgi:hypothetical protein